MRLFTVFLTSVAFVGISGAALAQGLQINPFPLEQKTEPLSVTPSVNIEGERFKGFVEENPVSKVFQNLPQDLPKVDSRPELSADHYREMARGQLEQATKSVSLPGAVALVETEAVEVVKPDMIALLPDSKPVVLSVPDRIVPDIEDIVPDPVRVKAAHIKFHPGGAAASHSSDVVKIASSPIVSSQRAVAIQPSEQFSGQLDTLQMDVRALEEMFVESQKEPVALEGQIRALQGQVGGVQSALSLAQKEPEVLGVRIQELQGQISGLQAELQASKKAPAILDGRMQSLQAKVSVLEGQLAQAKADPAVADENMRVLQGKIQALETQLSVAQSEKLKEPAKDSGVLEGQVEALQAQVKVLSSQLAVAQAQPDVLTKRMAALEAQLADSKVERVKEEEFDRVLSTSSVHEQQAVRGEAPPSSPRVVDLTATPSSRGAWEPVIIPDSDALADIKVPQKRIKIEANPQIPALKTQPVPVAQAVQKDTYDWMTHRGETVRSVLERWGTESGVEVVWQGERDFGLMRPIKVDGAFENAVRVLLDQYMNEAERPVGHLQLDNGSGRKRLTIQSSAG